MKKHFSYAFMLLALVFSFVSLGIGAGNDG